MKTYSNRGSMANTIVVIVAVLVVGFLLYRYSPLGSSRAPSANEVEPLIKAYLSGGSTLSNCTSKVEILQLSDISVGDFNKQFDGWPVYASHKESCMSGRNTLTYDGLDSVSKKVAVTFVHRVNGRLESFTPAFFQAAQRQLNDAFNNIQFR